MFAAILRVLWIVRGLKFLEAAHIKDLLALLRWAENLRDRVSGFRVIQLLPGAGPATTARLLDRLAETDHPLEALADFQPPKACAEDWPGFADTVRLVRGNAAGWPTEVELVCRWYKPHLERLHEDTRTREVDLLQSAGPSRPHRPDRTAPRSSA
jgi:DNA helicase-2/ATP-dependent DNA helicase PcrA